MFKYDKNLNQVKMGMGSVEGYTSSSSDSKKKMWKTIGMVLLILAVIVGGYMLYKKSGKKEGYEAPKMGFSKQKFGFRFY
jgi:hypothetical protein